MDCKDFRFFSLIFYFLIVLVCLYWIVMYHAHSVATYCSHYFQKGCFFYSASIKTYSKTARIWVRKNIKHLEERIKEGKLTLILFHNTLYIRKQNLKGCLETKHTVPNNSGLFRNIDGNVTAKKLYTWEKFKIGNS